MTTCKNCGAELAENVKFCPKCGTKNEPKHFCSSCGAEIQLNVKFCPKCGANQIEKTQPAASQTVVQNKESVQQNQNSVQTGSVSTKERVLSLLPNIFLILVIIVYFTSPFVLNQYDEKWHWYYWNGLIDLNPVFFLIITLSEICAVITVVLSVISFCNKKSFDKIIAIIKDLGVLFLVIAIVVFYASFWNARVRLGFLGMILGWLLSSSRIPLGKE